MQIASSGTWSRVAMLKTYVDNYYTTNASTEQYVPILSSWMHIMRVLNVSLCINECILSFLLSIQC